jgi:uncharacterized membrane protein
MMVRPASVVLKRLRATWFGSVLAVAWLAFLIFVPWVRDCFGIAAVRGGTSGIYCTWNPPIIDPSGLELVLLVLFVALIAIVPLAFPNRPTLLAVGFGSAAISVSMIVAIHNLWVPLTFLVFLLPASVVWIVAGFRRPGRVRGVASG